MTRSAPSHARTVALYPWFKAGQQLTFWQAIWFLYFQQSIGAAQAILLYAVYDVATTLVEVPSGYLSDRIGRRPTLIASSVAGTAGVLALALGDGFAAFALGQILLGCSAALQSGTDSAILYESLVADDRADEIEAQEVRAWRFGFSALAVSAVLGGAAYMWAAWLPFALTAVAFASTILIAISFTEPPRHTTETTELGRLLQLRRAIRTPLLAWIFVLSVLMYGYSHLPFVFGQPFIDAALTTVGLSDQTPLVSGAVTSAMMLVSVGTSVLAPRVRSRIGLSATLLFAFGLQIVLAAVLAASNAVGAIAILLLRMVPDSLARPFILARIQPMLEDDSRATYLSLQSLTGRLAFAGSLWVASGGANAGGEMAFAEIRTILTVYAVVGVGALIGLALWARRLPVDQRAGQDA